LEHRVNDAVTLRQNTRYYNNEVDDRSIYTTALLADQSTISRALYVSFGKVHGFNLDNQAQFKFSTAMLDHTLLSGLDFQHVGSNSLQTYGAAPNLDIFNPVYGSTVASAPVFKNEDVTQNQIGLYLQDQVKFGEHWRATLGGRYDRADSMTKNQLTGLSTTQDDHALTGRVGLVYVDDNGLAPYFSYTQSFLPALCTDAGGKALKPETGEQYEWRQIPAEKSKQLHHTGVFRPYAHRLPDPRPHHLCECTARRSEFPRRRAGRRRQFG